MFMQGKSIVGFENEVFLYLAIDLSDQGMLRSIKLPFPWASQNHMHESLPMPKHKKQRFSCSEI